MRIIGLVGVISYGIASISAGIAQQRVGMSADQIDCAYRASLLRARVVALTERSPQESLGDPQDEIVSTLLRETLNACVDEPDPQHQLVEIEARLREHQRLRTREAQARSELLAL